MKNLIIFKFEPTTHNMSQLRAVKRSQYVASINVAVCCVEVLRRIVWPGLKTVKSSLAPSQSLPVIASIGFEYATLPTRPLFNCIQSGNKELQKARPRRRGHLYEFRGTLKPFTLFITVKDITKLNLGYND